MAANEQVRTPGVSKRIGAIAALVVSAAALLAPATAHAQFGDGPPPAPAQRPPRASDSLRAASDCYRAGDYESADALCQQAEQSKQQLSAAELKDLTDLKKSNGLALKQSRDGAEQVAKANDFLEKGKLQDAASLVRTLNTNAYLKASDRAQLTAISEQLKARGVVVLAGNASGAKTLPPELPKDYRTLVKMARAACDMGELDKAQVYCKAAAEAHSAWQPNWAQPWNDNEDKVLEDVRKQRLELAATKAAKAAQSADKKDATKDAVAPQVSQQTLEARALLEKSKEALKNNDLPAAKMYADQAKPKVDQNSWVEKRSYEQVVGEIQRRQGVVQVSAKADLKDVDAGILPPPLPPGVDGPAAKPVDPKNARKSLEEARNLFTQNKLEDAERLCAQVAAVKASPPWGLFEDNPDKLRKDINAARLKSDKAESVRLLGEARRLLAAGNYQEARIKTWRARQLHGPYGVMEIGDRPDRLLIEIDTAEAKAKKNGIPPAPPSTLVKDSPEQKTSGLPAGLPAATPKTAANELMANDKSASTTLPSVAAMSAKQRAQGLLDEARTLQKQGDLVQAQTKAHEAQVAALEAQKAGYGFGPGEDSPELFQRMLAVQAKTRIDGLVHVADEQSTGFATDPARQKKAVDSLTKAKDLALHFGIDSQPIDRKLDELRSSAPGGVQTAELAPGSGNLGEELLEHARQEIRAGRYETARKMAEDAFNLKYGVEVQKKAEMVLRSIDIEECKQRSINADNDFRAAYDAYLHKNYRQAEAILANLDQRLLSPECQNRLREIAMDPNMQPTARQQPEVMQLVGTDVGTARATDSQTVPGVKTGGDQVSMDSIKQMERVVFDKAMKDGLAAQKEALQRGAVKDYDGAIEILKTYRASLEETRLPEDQLVRLRPVIERQIQNFQQRKQLDDFAVAQAKGNVIYDGKAHEVERVQKKQEKDNQLVKMMDQYNVLMREHKYQEAYVLAEQAGEIDPDNTTVQMARAMAKTQMRIKEQNEINARAEVIGYKELNFEYGEYATVKNPVVFDKDINERARKRTDLSHINSDYHDAKERALDRALREKYLTMSFNNQPLESVVHDIKEYIGDNININFDHTALAQAGIRTDRLLSQSFNNICLKSALNILLKDAELTYVIKDQAIIITTEEYARGKQQVSTYNVTDLVVPIENKVSPLQQLHDARIQKQVTHDLTRGMGFGGGSAYTGPYTLQNGQPVGTPTGMQPNNSLTGPPKPTGNQPLEELLMRLIRNTIAPDSWSEVGGKGTINYFPLGMALVVNQTQDIQEQIVDLLQALRRLQDLEVAIEMRLVSVSESFFEYMGVNFDMNITNNQSKGASTLVSGVFAPNGQINSFQPSSFVSGLTPAGTFTPDLGIPIRSSSFDFATPPFGGFPGTLGSDGGISLGLAFLSDIQVYMYMEAAQGDRRTNTMQAPKITVFNGQTASISVLDELEFLDSIDVNQLSGQMLFTPEQNLQGYGVAMTVTPVVSADRRFVRLNLTPTLNNLVSASVPLLPVQQIVPQLLYDNISPPQPQVFTLFFQQPSSSTITLSTTVVVPDGGTVLMGGLKTLVEGRNEYGPPVLSKIPYLSRLFKNVGYGREAQSLMIMVTARIIINEEEEQEFLGNLPRIPR